MYSNYSTRKIWHVSLSFFLIGILSTIVLYFFTDLVHDENIGAVILSSIIFTGISTLGAWFRYKHPEPLALEIREISWDSDQFPFPEIRSLVKEIAAAKDWRILQENDHFIEIQTPIRQFESVGEKITVNAAADTIIFESTLMGELQDDYTQANKKNLEILVNALSGVTK